MSQERSAEFYRGALSVLEGRPCTAQYYRTLLAEAEAREASVPTAAERDFLGEARLAAIELANTLAKERITAAEVIAAAELALYGIDSITRCVHLDMGGKHKYHIQHPGQHEAIEEVKRTLAAIAKWKEARNA